MTFVHKLLQCALPIVEINEITLFSKCIQSAKVKKTPFFSGGALQLAETSPAPCWWSSCSQSASTTKWTIAFLQTEDTVAHWWTLTGTLSPYFFFFLFFSFNRLHECTQATMSTCFISNQPLSKELRQGHAAVEQIMLFLIYKKDCCHLIPLQCTWIKFKDIWIIQFFKH